MKTNCSVSDLDSSTSYSSNGTENYTVQKNTPVVGAAPDFLNGVERRLKELWSDYVEYQDKYGFDEMAKALKKKYFSLYQSYRRNKNWKQLVSEN